MVDFNFLLLFAFIIHSFFVQFFIKHISWCDNAFCSIHHFHFSFWQKNALKVGISRLLPYSENYFTFLLNLSIRGVRTPQTHQEIPHELKNEVLDIEGRTPHHVLKFFSFSKKQKKTLLAMLEKRTQKCVICHRAPQDFLSIVYSSNFVFYKRGWHKRAKKWMDTKRFIFLPSQMQASSNRILTTFFEKIAEFLDYFSGLEEIEKF